MIVIQFLPHEDRLMNPNSRNQKRSAPRSKLIDKQPTGTNAGHITAQSLTNNSVVQQLAQTSSLGSPNPGVLQKAGGNAASRKEIAATNSSLEARRTATAGVSGSGRTLPYADVIQKAFGQHDIGTVRAHIGGDSASACDTLGADAYATGDRVAFSTNPSLHTAAHEAAHVIQQRAGVHLSGGVGQPGDEYERHANTVADRVVAGQSAESLLDEKAGPKTGDSGLTNPTSLGHIQRQTMGDAVQFNDPPTMRGGPSREEVRRSIADTRRFREETERRAASPPETSASGTVRGATDGQADVTGLNGSFTLRAGTILSSTASREMRTERETRVHIQLNATELLLFSHPSIHIDAQWPAQNMQVLSVRWDFTRGEPIVSVQLIGGLGEGFLDYSDTARQSIGDLLRNCLRGTDAARPGYNPLTEPDAAGLITRITANFNSLPAEGTSSVSAPTSPELGATLTMRRQFRQSAGSGDTALHIPAGGSFGLSVRGGGNLESILASRDAGSAAAAFRFESATLTSSALTIESGGRPQVQLQEVTLTRGGQVRLGRFEVAGTPGALAGLEALLRVIGGAMTYHAHGVGSDAAMELAVRSGEATPTLIPGLTRQMVEDGMTQAIRQMILQNRNAITGVDLAQALGIAE